MLLDDELPGLTYLKMLCEQIPELEVVKAFNNPQTFVAEFQHLDFDLCILDIEMPGLNGLQVANLLNGKSVIFTTAYKEYAAEAFDLDAIDYVRKPVKKERLQEAVQKAIRRTEKTATPKRFMQLNTEKGKALIFFDEIAIIRNSEIDSRDKTATMNDGSALLLKNISFEKLEELLPADEFCRINKKEILALNKVRFFSFDEITTTISTRPGETLKVNLSEVYRSDFIAKLKV